uniref:Uncharacterized protein n=1 Tax=Bracon brevicornis TaxID=1563983 RepID=A0A6V7KPX3_9HYME
MVCPVTVCLKILLQKFWSQDVGWDTPLDGDVRETFLQWQRGLEFLKEVHIPRWAFGNNNSRLSLHLFTDASKDAYAAVVFSRVEMDQGVDLYLLEAKTRVAPRDKSTIPRLELLAATVGARLLHSILEILEPDHQANIQVYCWTDSSTVLSWIQRQQQWATFVWNRVQKIRRLTNSDDWRHVPEQLNPADLPSRGCSHKQLIDTQWWQGPSSLRQSPEYWLAEKYDVLEEEIAREWKKSTMVKKRKATNKTLVNNTLSNVTSGGDLAVVDLLT